MNLNTKLGTKNTFLLRNGELSSDYNGPREASGITKYMKSQVDCVAEKLYIREYTSGNLRKIGVRVNVCNVYRQL